MRVPLTLRPILDRELTFRQSPISQAPTVEVGYSAEVTFPDAVSPDPPTDISVIATNRSTGEAVTATVVTGTPAAAGSAIEFELHQMLDGFPYLVQLIWTDSLTSLDHTRYLVINCRGVLL